MHIKTKYVKRLDILLRDTNAELYELGVGGRKESLWVWGKTGEPALGRSCSPERSHPKASDSQLLYSL